MQIYRWSKIDQCTGAHEPENYSAYKCPEQWHHPVEKPSSPAHWQSVLRSLVKLAAGLSIRLMKCDLAHNSRSITPLDVSPGADSRLNHRCLDVPFASIVSVQFRRMKAVCLWSGPRNVSTALMYSFAQRADTKVVDEPLYGHYLRVTGAQHPLRKEVLAAVNTDGNEVMRALLNEPANEVTRVLFMKQMAHHLVDLDQGFMQ